MKKLLLMCLSVMMTLSAMAQSKVYVTRDMEKDDPRGPYSLMTLIYEIPLLENDFIKVSEDKLPTYIGKILLEHLETHDVPVKIRKQFDRERFIADVRDFFVNVKGCKL